MTVFSGKIPELNSLVKSGDLYTLSTCRDLCFHTQEYKSTINQLNEILQFNEFKVSRILIQQPVKSLYMKYFPDERTQTNLQNCATFEEKYPNPLKAIYQFWVSKL